jgi:hypothetical protein
LMQYIQVGILSTPPLPRESLKKQSTLVWSLHSVMPLHTLWDLNSHHKVCKSSLPFIFIGN